MKIEDILFEPIYEKNNEILGDLRENVNKKESHEEWVLCLGAGVSISAGLPDWYGLLAEITAQILPTENSYALRDKSRDDWGVEEKDNKNNTVSVEKAQSRETQSFKRGVGSFFECLGKLSNDAEYLEKMANAQKGQYKYIFGNINVLESAEYIRNYIEQELQPDETLGENKEDIEKNINWHINYFIQQICSNSLKYPMDSEEITKTTLGAVARLLKSDRDSIIHDVITYNYDNLLEEYLRKRCKCDPKAIHSVIKRDPLPRFGDQKSWNIYHVHGRIPVFEHKGESMSEQVILTESDYYKEERINYSWTNTIQSYVFGRANMIFIGFSGTDYNFRRLLKYINQDSTNLHERYIFFSVDDVVNAVFSDETRKGKCIADCIDEMKCNDDRYAYEKLLINYLIHAQAMYWLKYGIKVIWTSHEELPGMLDKLH